MKNYIEQLTAKIEQKIAELPLPVNPAGLYEPIVYIMADGGKRMRPMLTLLACDLFSGDPMRAMPSALSLEMFHNFTLLHDDIMDRAPRRRGRDTVHVRWNDNTAILSGDAMMIFSYTLLAQSDRFTDVFPLFSRSSIEVCEGQQMDMDFENLDSVSMDQYMEMIRLKTASLMSSSLVIGAVEGGATSRQQELIYRFGEQLGLAFQIQDDLLDTFGDQKTFGKRIGGDISEGKKTFLMITARDLCDDSDLDLLIRSRDFATVKGIYEKYGVEKIARQTIECHYNSAMESLDEITGKDMTLMREYAQMILRREK